MLDSYAYMLKGDFRLMYAVFMLRIFMLLCCRLLTFLKKKNFFENSLRNTIRMSNSLDPDQEQHFVGPDPGPYCLQRFSADDKKSYCVYFRKFFDLDTRLVYIIPCIHHILIKRLVCFLRILETYACLFVSVVTIIKIID